MHNLVFSKYIYWSLPSPAREGLSTSYQFRAAEKETAYVRIGDNPKKRLFSSILKQAPHHHLQETKL